MTITQRSATQLLAELNGGDLTSEQITRAYLDQISLHDRKLGAFIRVDAEGALDQAAAIDRRRAAGEPLGRLAGLPVAVCAASMASSAGWKLAGSHRSGRGGSMI